MDNILKRIERACKEQGIYIEDLAETTQLLPEIIKSWDEEKPTPNQILSVAIALQVSPYWLLSGQCINKMSFEEECLIFLYRMVDKRERRIIINTACNLAF